MRKIVRILSVMLIVTSLWATETRLATMGSDLNLLPNDEMNIYMYPSMVTGFGNFATLEFGTLPAWGFGTYPAGILAMGNDRISVALLGNRPIYNTNHPNNPLTVNAYGVVIGSSMGALNLGVEINMGIRQMSNTPAANTTYSYNAMFIGIIPAVSLRNGRMGIDVSLPFTLENWKDNGYTVTTDTFKFSGTPALGLNLRFFNGTRRRKTIGTIRFSYIKDAYDHNGTTFNNGSILGAEFDFGSCIRPMRGSKMLGGLNFNFTNTSTSDTSGTTTLNADLVFGGEAMVSSAFGFRAGINRRMFFYTKTKNGAVSNSTIRFADDPLNVSIGAYLKLRNIRIDASIAQDLLFNGPYFLTGAPSRLAGTISIIAKL